MAVGGAERKITVKIVGEAKQFTGTAQEVEGWLAKLDNAVEKSGTNAAKTGGVFGALGKSLKGELNDALGESSSSLGRLGNVFGDVTGSGGKAALAIGGVGAALGGTVVAVKAGIDAYTSLADTVRQFKDITGATAQDSSRIIAALDDVGVSAEAGSKAFAALAKNADSKGFAALGVEIAKAKDGTTDLSGTFENLLKKLDGMSDPIQRANVLQAAFGKTWQEVLPLIDRGAEGYERLLKANENSGQILSDKDLEQAREFKAVMDQLGDVFQKFVLEVGKFSLPFVKTAAEDISKFGEGIDKAGGFVADLIHKFGPLETVAKAVGAVLFSLPVALHELANISLDKVEHALQRLIDTADKIAGPFINFPDDVFHNKHLVIQGAVADTTDALKDLIAAAEQQKTALEQAASDKMAQLFGALGSAVKGFSDIAGGATQTIREQELAHAKLLDSILDVDRGVRDARANIAKTEEENARRIADARQKVADVTADAADRINKANDKVKQVAEEGRLAVEKAEAGIGDAVDKGAAAVEAAKQRQTDAMQKAKDAIVDAEFKAATVAAEGAEAIRKAEQAKVDAKTDGDAKVLAAEERAKTVREKALADYQRALDRFDAENERAAQRVTDATQKRDDTIIASNQRVSDAQARLTDVMREGAQRIADAEARVAQAAIDGAEKVKAAKESAAEAAENAAQRIADTEKSAAERVKSSDKSVEDAKKQRDRTIRDANKSVADAEKAYAEAVAKSGASSEAARNAAERLADVRESAAERIADANERLKDAEERAAEARKKGEEDVAKAKKDGAKSEEENKKRIAAAEKAAADGETKAKADLAKAQEDAAKAQTAAASAVTAAETQRTKDVAAAEKALSDARAEQEKTRLQGIKDVEAQAKTSADAMNEADKKVNDEKEARRVALAKADSEMFRVIGENAVKEIKAQADVQAAYKAKADAEVANAKAVKKAQEDAASDVAKAWDVYYKAVDASDKANRQAVKDTQQVVKDETDKMKKAWQDVRDARKEAAEKSQTAESNLTKELEAQRLKLLELKKQFADNDVDLARVMTNQIKNVQSFSGELAKIVSKTLTVDTKTDLGSDADTGTWKGLLADVAKFRIHTIKTKTDWGGDAKEAGADTYQGLLNDIAKVKNLMVKAYHDKGAKDEGTSYQALLDDVAKVKNLMVAAFHDKGKSTEDTSYQALLDDFDKAKTTLVNAFHSKGDTNDATSYAAFIADIAKPKSVTVNVEAVFDAEKFVSGIKSLIQSAFDNLPIPAPTTPPETTGTGGGGNVGTNGVMPNNIPDSVLSDPNAMSHTDSNGNVYKRPGPGQAFVLVAGPALSGGNQSTSIVDNPGALNGNASAGTSSSSTAATPAAASAGASGAAAAGAAVAQVATGSTLSAKAKARGYPTYRLQPVAIRFLNALAEVADIAGLIGSVGGYGTRTNATDHDDGLAVDLMLKTLATTNAQPGNTVAAWVLANRSQLGVTYIIFNKRINSGDGWRPYEGYFSNGTPKDPHFNHVHVSFRAGGGALVDPASVPAGGYATYTYDPNAPGIQATSGAPSNGGVATNPPGIVATSGVPTGGTAQHAIGTGMGSFDGNAGNRASFVAPMPLPGIASPIDTSGYVTIASGSTPVAASGASSGRGPVIVPNPDGSVGVGVGGSGDTVTTPATERVIDRQPIVIEIAGKTVGEILAEVTYEQIKLLALRRGDKTADGAWRVARR